MLKYDVVKDNKVVFKDTTFHALLNFFNLKSSSFSYYVKNRKEDQLIIKGYTVIVKNKPNIQSEMTIGLLKDWDNMTIAAELIRTGQGTIERRLINGKYRKVTVPNEIR